MKQSTCPKINRTFRFFSYKKLFFSKIMVYKRKKNIFVKTRQGFPKMRPTDFPKRSISRKSGRSVFCSRLYYPFLAKRTAKPAKKAAFRKVRAEEVRFYRLPADKVSGGKKEPFSATRMEARQKADISAEEVPCCRKHPAQSGKQKAALYYNNKKSRNSKTGRFRAIARLL